MNYKYRFKSLLNFFLMKILKFILLTKNRTKIKWAYKKFYVFLVILHFRLQVLGELLKSYLQ